MKLVQVVFLCLSLSALAEGLLSQGGLGGGFGGISGILGLFVLLIFVAAISRKPKCPTNYTETSPNSDACVRFFTTEKTFADARTACQNDGGDLLKPDLLNFDIVRALADANKGTGPCNFWIGAREAGDGVWSDLNGQSISTIAGLFFENAGDYNACAPNECGVLDHTRSFYLYGKNCTNPKCFICQENKTV
ncbi:hypothetical protein ACJMK2_021255 [Sinanodonta woodiana]|uniref:C-type lectin domain-containing protein n=1 Tax=Sinanodonta woodiana TaxID=1069815 RepID=A0ABD3TFI1_SINWO